MVSVEAPAPAAVEETHEVIISETTGPAGTARIVYTTGGIVDVAELDVLCHKVGWPSRPGSKVALALANSFLVCSLHLEMISNDGSEGERRLVGLARATSDHAFNATIWDVLVDPDFQGQVRDE